MSRLLPRIAAPDCDGVIDRAGDVPKYRKCLTCRHNFHSEWAGQRVCTKCKKKTQWRSGALRQSL